ncbi:MAG: hypothetical protein AYK19_21630 [Theionarchaea archaeon DG-70-1]|nr:MAG: hypothetical protein AYK19_21630 [Theionarchaea archaeon DG-70-1]
MEPEEKKWMKKSLILQAIVVVFFLCIYFTGLYRTCIGAQISMIFCILMLAVGYWLMGEKRKTSIVYVGYAIALFAIYIFARLVYDNCFGG